MKKQIVSSADSLIEATRDRAAFSGHGKALGAAGEKESSFDPANCEYLREPGQSIAVSPGPGGFENITISAEWDNVRLKNSGLLSRLVKKAAHVGVDLDLGCLYEMKDGARGAIQAFGQKFGAIDQPPYISLSADDRTGDTPGEDERLTINGARWGDIHRMVIYLYIYSGVRYWAQVNPRLMIDVPGEDDLVVTLGMHNDHLPLCAVGGLENVRGGIRLTNYTEYFPGHLEMDRAFGFGLQWDDGRK